MKKIISVLLLIVLTISLSACNKSNNTSSHLDINNSNASQNIESDAIDVLDPFELNSISYEIKLEELKSIVDYDFSRKSFITSDGSLYKIGKFSDGTNLKKISEGLNLLKFRDKILIVSDNNFLYSYIDSDFSIKPHFAQPIDGKDYTNQSFVTFNNSPLYKATLKNNEIYLANGPDDRQLEFKIHSFPDDEKIELFINGTIKTNKGYYYFKKTTNHSEYDDVPDTTTFSLEKITVLDDDIIFIKYYECNLCVVDKNGCLKIYNGVRI